MHPATPVPACNLPPGVVVEAHDIEPGEFSIRVRTWDDTVIYNVLIAWLAHD